MLGPMPHRAMTRINNAPSSVIAYGDATFPPGWGRFGGRVLKASPQLASEARLMRGRKVDPQADKDIRPYNA